MIDPATETPPDLKVTVGVAIVSLEEKERVTVSPTLAPAGPIVLFVERLLDGKVGAVASIVIESPDEVAETLPAASVCLAVIVCPP